MAATIFTILCLLLSALNVFLILRFIFQGFIDRDARMSFTRLCISITEPIVGPLRSLIPPIGIFDISMLVAFVMIHVMQQFTQHAGGTSLLPF